MAAGCAEHCASAGLQHRHSKRCHSREPQQALVPDQQGCWGMQGSCAARAVYDEVDFTAALLRGARCQPGREFPSSLEKDDRQQLHGLAGPCASRASSPLRTLNAAQCQREDSTGSPATREHNWLCSVSTTGRDFRKSGFVVEYKLELR